MKKHILWISCFILLGSYQIQAQKIRYFALLFAASDYEHWDVLDESVKVDDCSVIDDSRQGGRFFFNLREEENIGELERYHGHNGKWGFVDKNGKVIIEAEYAYVNLFQGNFAIVQNYNEQWGIINKTGQIIIPLIYDIISSPYFPEGLSAVKKSKKWGFIDKNRANASKCNN